MFSLPDKKRKLNECQKKEMDAAVPVNECMRMNHSWPSPYLALTSPFGRYNIKINILNENIPLNGLVEGENENPKGLQ